MILFDSELKQMENAIANVVDETLNNIYRKFVDIDYVLDDNDGSFKNYFLERAGSRLSSSYSAFVIKARANKRNRNATIEISDDTTDSNSTIDETLYEMKRKLLDKQVTIETQSFFESINSPYSDVSTIGTSTAIDIKTENIETSTNNVMTQSNNIESAICCSSDAKANVTGDIKSETMGEPEVKGVEEPVEMKTKTFNEITSPKNKCVVSNKPTPITSIPRLNVLLFYCVHCQDETVTSESFESVFELHNHWLSAHANSFQPFHFYAGLQCVCYLCKKTGSFQEILNHFIVRHPGRRIGISKCLNENKCAICDFIGENIADHFQLKHPITTNADFFNPIRFSKDFLEELNAIDIRKKFKCQCCDDQFNTQSQIIDHYNKSVNHNLQKYPYEDMIEKLPPAYECGLCRTILEEQKIRIHLRNHEINCPNCSSFKGTIRELESHNRLKHSNASIDNIKTDLLKGFLATKIIQSNGLILNKSNLLSPKDDESKMLCTLFKTLRPNVLDSNKPDSKEASSKTEEPKASDPKTKSMSIENLPKSYRKRNVDRKREAASSFHQNGKDLPDRVKREHLAKQKKLLQQLCIIGLPENDGTRNVLMDMFKKLCTHLDVEIEDNDVIMIQKEWFTKNDIIVVLRDSSKHESILLHANRIKNLQSDDFLRLTPGRRPQDVFIMPAMTNHYARLEKRAKDHIRNRLLFSSRISDRGLAVKVSENSMEEYVNSCRELDNYVLDNNETVSAPNTPKRGKLR